MPNVDVDINFSRALVILSRALVSWPTRALVSPSCELSRLQVTPSAVKYETIALVYVYALGEYWGPSLSTAFVLFSSFVVHSYCQSFNTCLVYK